MGGVFSRRGSTPRKPLERVDIRKRRKGEDFRHPGLDRSEGGSENNGKLNLLIRDLRTRLKGGWKTRPGEKRSNFPPGNRKKESLDRGVSWDEGEREQPPRR